LDEELRPAIDRLISAGGRLTVRGSTAAGPAVVTLDQPGSRFGILEVHARAELSAPDQATIQALLGAGWSDPSVTVRLGREFRISPSGAADGPITVARTWRVPPVLAAEIVLDVRTAAGSIESLELEALGIRRPSADPAATTASGHAPPIPQLDDAGDDLEADELPPGRRLAARTVPAPFRAIGAVALVVVIGVAWVGMIRGAPRVAGGDATSPAGAGVVSTPTPIPTPTPLVTAEPTPSPTNPLATHVVAASTETKAGRASEAIDGNPATAWHAAFGVPQWIEIGLDAPSTVHEVTLLIAQKDQGTTRHMIQVAQVGGVYQVVGIVDRLTSDGDTLRFVPSTPIENVERIRIETMASPSDAGWYEVIVR
jgi:hypothetical protein